METILPTKNKLVQDTEGNEENDTQLQTPTKQRLNYTKEPNEAHKNSLKEETLQVITENFMECYYT
jgi:hypothetical protein